MSTGVWYHSMLPLCAAGVITAFSLFVPLRIGYILLSREFATLVLRISILLLIATSIAYPASLAANSAEPAVAALGSVLFIGLLTTAGAILLGVGKTVAARSLPHLIPAFKNLRARAHGWMIQMSAAMRGS